LEPSGVNTLRGSRRLSPPPVPALVQLTLDILQEYQIVVKIPVKIKLASEKIPGANPVNPEVNHLKCDVRCSKEELLWASAK